MEDMSEGFNAVKLLERQRNYFLSGQTREVEYRRLQLKRFKEAVINHESRIMDALKKDLNKSPFEAYSTEVGLLINELDFMLKKLNSLTKPKRVKTPLMFFGGSSHIVPEPYGNVLIISPWNYPLLLALGPLVGSIAAGNCTIIKTSEFAPNVSKVIVELISEVFPEEYVAVVEGEAEKSVLLLEQKFDYMFFTGSTKIGKVVMEAASRNLTPVTLELGGKSPCIVDDDINLEYTARRIVWGKFVNAGQTCVAPDYLLVHKEIKNELLQKIKEVLVQFFGENPITSDSYGRIVNERHFERLKAFLSEGKVLTGGEWDKGQLYIAPTVLTEVSGTASVMKEEIFGPILPVTEFETLDEAIGFIVDRPKPLALYVFSNNNGNIKKVLQRTSSGGVCINDTVMHISTAYLPFGGVGESGMGSYHGAATFDTFTHKKSVLRNQVILDPKVKYPPYKASLNVIKKLMKLL